MIKVGILALQGNVQEHLDILRNLGTEYTEVRTTEDLSGCSHLIIPGGESTVMSRFLFLEGLGEAIIERTKKQELAIYGTCAGAILLAKKLRNANAPRTLGLMDMEIERNAYGTQLQSFEHELSIKGIEKPVMAAFIRAPRIVGVESGIEILAAIHDEPVLVRENRLLAGTFHPEARSESAIHSLFLRM